MIDITLRNHIMIDDIMKLINSHMRIVEDIIGMSLSLEEIEPVMFEHVCLSTRPLHISEISRLEEHNMWGMRFITNDDQHFQLEVSYDEIDYRYILSLYIGDEHIEDAPLIVDLLMKELDISRI